MFSLLAKFLELVEVPKLEVFDTKKRKVQIKKKTDLLNFTVSVI